MPVQWMNYPAGFAIDNEMRGNCVVERITRMWRDAKTGRNDLERKVHFTYCGLKWRKKMHFIEFPVQRNGKESIKSNFV